MDPDLIVKLINQAVEQLAEKYSKLTGYAQPAADKLNQGLGRLKVWKVQQTSSTGPDTMPIITYSYWDTKPRWWHWLVGFSVVGIEDHPEKEEAEKAVTQLLGESETNQKNFELDAEKVGLTTGQIGTAITTWMTTRSQIANNVTTIIPENMDSVSSSGDLRNWTSPKAKQGYASVYSQQRQAALTSMDIIKDLYTNNAALLNSIGSKLSQLAGLTLAEDEFWTKQILDLPIPTDPEKFVPYEFFKSLVDQGIGIVQQHQKDQVQELSQMGSDLNGTIDSLMKLSDIEIAITTLGKGNGAGGWPNSEDITLGQLDEGAPSRETLVFCAQYFHDHADKWREVSQALQTPKNTAATVPQIDKMFQRVPNFAADKSAVLNQLKTKVTDDILGHGVKVTEEVAKKLDQTIIDYLKAEDEGRGLANSVYKEIYGTDMP